ncbi:MAG: HupE/UreJ family protein [Bradymonadaceae bacterium]
MLSRLLLIFLAFTFVFGLAVPVAAHQTAQSNVLIHVKPETRQVDFLLSVASRDVAHYLGLIEEVDVPDQELMEGATADIIAFLDAQLVARNDGVICPTTEARIVRTGPLTERTNFLKAVECEEPLGEVNLESRAMLDAVGGYRHFGRVQVGEDVYPTVFDTQFPDYILHLGVDDEGGVTVETSALDTFLRYLWQGILHIVIGFDHVLFVLCLLLAARRFRQLLFIITAFTLGHSVTLVVSALDVFTLPESLIEPIIALSIAYVAAENLLRKGEVPYLYATALVFGLVHGFGFSYVLRDELGLPTEALVPALVSFNLGVEVGQLAIVALAYPALLWARTKGWYPTMLRWGSATILVIALYWLVSRVVWG